MRVPLHSPAEQGGEWAGPIGRPQEQPMPLPTNNEVLNQRVQQLSPEREKRLRDKIFQYIDDSDAKECRLADHLLSYCFDAIREAEQAARQEERNRIADILMDCVNDGREFAETIRAGAGMGYRVELFTRKCQFCDRDSQPHNNHMCNPCRAAYDAGTPSESRSCE
jgi:hypothetical protein